MKHSGFPANYWLLSALVAALAMAQGCGTGEYEKRMQAKTWTRGLPGGGGAPSGPRADVPGVAATISPPANMEAQATPTNPPGANVAGLKAAYEGFVVDAAQGKQYYYCYLISAEAGADAMEPVLKSLQAAIQGDVNWEKKDSEEKGADGKPLKIRTAFAKGKQKFGYVTQGGEKQTSETDGVLQVWDREIQPGGAHLLIVWRVPAALATKQYVNPEERGRSMALSVAPKQAAPAGAAGK